MKENIKFFGKMMFGLEVAFVLIIPFVIWWSTTPTNILNSNTLFQLLEIIGVWGSHLILFFGIPVGIFGIITAKRMIKLRNATIVLSIINLVTGSVEVIIMLVIFCAVAFGGVSV